MRRLIFLVLVCFIFVGFSFADLSSELQSCGSNMNTCSEKAFKKYEISKTKACLMKDDVYTHQPLQTSWPKKKSFSKQFYKYNNVIYYIVDVYPSDLQTSGYDIEHYLYSYNCKTKKVLDMNINTDNRWTIINILNAYKSNIVLNFLTDEGGGGIYMFDSKAMLLHDFNDLTSMKNYSSFEKKLEI